MFNIKKYRSENPISTRLLAMILLFSGFVACITIAIQLYLSFNDDVTMLDQRLEQVRISSLPSIGKSLWGFDEEQLSIQVDSLLQLNDVELVAAVWKDWDNKQQRMVVTSGRLKGIGFEFEVENIASRLTNRYLVKKLPIEYADDNNEVQQLGMLYLAADLSTVYSKLRERATLIVLTQGGKTFLLAIAILYFIRRLLIRHIEAIAAYARSLTLQDLSLELALPDKKKLARGHRRDELDNVTDAINQMRLSLIDDIDKREQVEKALIRNIREKEISRLEREEAEAANRAKSQFLATMSHEIRTPMNGVLGMIELLKDTQLDENQRHYVEVINRSGKSLVNIINDILDYSKIEAGKMELDVSEFDLDVLLEDCMYLFTNQARSKNISLMAHVAPFTPTKLVGDASRLRQILINLIGNAFKFTETGFVLIEASQRVSASNQSIVVEFSVHDSGIGIAEEAQSKLFDSFSQADKSTTRQYGGTGLGLSISKRLAELMNGDIGLSSKLGEGSSFWFTVELECAQRSDAALVCQNASDNLKAKRMLLVGGNEIFNNILVYHGFCWGMDMHYYQSPDEAFSYFKSAEKSIDFVAIDSSIENARVESFISDITKASNGELKIFLIGTSTDLERLPTEERSFVRGIIPRPYAPNYIRSAILSTFENTVKEKASNTDVSELDKTSKLSQLAVLIAEDNSVNQLVISGVMNKIGIKPVIVENGLQALDTYKTEPDKFDVVLMDCEMPVMDGLEATQKIRDWEKQKNKDPIKVFALTAHALKEYADNALASGMDGVLHKPIEMGELLSALEQCLN